MINRVVLVGRLTKDPELRYTPSGLAVVRFTLAINRPFQGQNGEKEADFINCIAWRKQAENLANFQTKGNLIGIEGRIQTGSYEGQDGKRVFTTDVVADSIQFLEPRNSNNTSGENSQPQQQLNQNQQQGGQQNPPQQQQQRKQPDFSDPNGQNYTRMDEDPFANPRGPIEVTEDDLPF